MAGPDTTLFHYYFATQPQPLQSGDESGQSNGTINMHVAAPSGGNAYTNRIVLVVPVGDGGLFQDTPICSINTGKWAITSAAKVGGETIGLVADQAYATYTLDCLDPADYGVTYNLVVALAGAVTAAEGSYHPAVQESSGTTSDPSGFTLRQAHFTLLVVPPQFYVSNLVSYVTCAPTVPNTEFSAGMDVNLKWESNGTWFQVFKKGDTKPFYAGTQTTCTLAGGVNTDTSFFLVASMTGDPSDDTPNFSTTYLYDSITVTITNPILTPTSVATSGIVSVGTNLTVGGTANVTGKTTLANTLVQGALGVTGLTTMASANVTNGLSVGGPNVTSGLSVNGGANIAGNVGINTTTPIAALTVQTGSQQPNANGNASNGLLISAFPEGASLNLGIYDNNAAGTQSGWIQTAYSNSAGVTGNLALNPLGGPVGINTMSPVAPLHVATIGFGYQQAQGAWYGGDPMGGVPYLGAASISIYAQTNIAAHGLLAFSDERITANQEAADGSKDLDLLNGLSVKNYRLRDHVAHGGTPHKGLLGQEVEGVFPQAVQTGTDYIPSVLALAKGTSLSGGVLTITMGNDHGLVTGDMVRLITAGNGARECLVQVADERTFDVPEWEGEEEGVFVYGKRVDDFRSVDYQQVFCLGISAIQALSKQLDDATRRIERLERAQAEAGSGPQKTVV